MDWVLIFEIVLKMLENCPDDEAQLQKRLRRIGPLELFVLRRNLLAGGVQRSQLNAAVRRCCDDAEKATPEELSEFVGMAKAGKAGAAEPTA